MISREQLEGAHKNGLLQAGQIAPLLDFLTQHEDNNAGRPDPEEVHFARGFHDIFISIGLIILFIGFTVGMIYLMGDQSGSLIILFAGMMALSWGLAEWFSKKLRLSLPSILLSGAFVMASGLAADSVIHLIQNSEHTSMLNDFSKPDRLQAVSWINGLAFVFAFAMGWLFYRRFNVPITPAFMMVTVVGLILFCILMIDRALLADYFALWLFFIGLASLIIAMVFDMRDPKRETIDSDKAFWLHLLAAPLLVHAILSSFSGPKDSSMASMAIIALVAGLGFVALMIDRRAILASALGYLGFAIGTLLQHINFDKAGLVALTLLVLGMFVLMLGSGWSALRRIVIRPWADFRFVRFVPPVSS